MWLLGGVGTVLSGTISLLFKKLLDAKDEVAKGLRDDITQLRLDLDKSKEAEKETRELLYRTVDLGERVVRKAARER